MLWSTCSKALFSTFYIRSTLINANVMGFVWNFLLYPAILPIGGIHPYDSKSPRPFANKRPWTLPFFSCGRWAYASRSLHFSSKAAARNATARAPKAVEPFFTKSLSVAGSMPGAVKATMAWGSFRCSQCPICQSRRPGAAWRKRPPGSYPQQP